MADLPEMLDAVQVAKTLGVSIQRLVRMAERGEYPDLVCVSRGVYRIERAEHEMWVASRRATARAARAVIAAARVRDALRPKVEA